MLIKCPECGKEVSDKAKMWIGCGFPIEEFGKEMLKREEPEKEPYTICPKCGSSSIRYGAVGTQRVVDEIQKLLV